MYDIIDYKDADEDNGDFDPSISEMRTIINLHLDSTIDFSGMQRYNETLCSIVSEMCKQKKSIFNLLFGNNKRNVMINNISGCNAFVVFSPCKMKSFNCLGLEKITQIDTTLQCSIPDASSKMFILDENCIYCNVFLEENNNKWRLCNKNKRMHLEMYETINLLVRNFTNSVKCDFVPYD